MKKSSPTITALLFVVFMAGCAGGAYQPSNWAHSAGDADWDIDSAVCLQHSENFTEYDRQEIEKLKREAEANAETVLSAASTLSYDDDLDSAASVVSGLFGAIAGGKISTIEETYKEDRFASCLRAKGWRKS